MKILIAVPCMDMVSARFAQSLATLQRPCDTAVAFQIGSLVYESRNKLVQQAIKFESDFVLWLDSDMIFPPDTLMRLMKHMEDGKDIVSGLYFRRVLPFAPVLYKDLKRGGGWSPYDDYPRNSVFEIAGCGFGCVLVRSDVFFDTANQEGWFSPMDHFGEDLSFCIRAREAGYKIYCDSTIKCGHMGYAIVDEGAYMATKKG